MLAKLIDLSLNLSNDTPVFPGDPKVKLVGVEGPSPDKEPYPIHKILLANDILKLENLCNLDKLPEKFKVYAFPIKVKTDGIPVRVVAEA